MWAQIFGMASEHATIAGAGAGGGWVAWMSRQMVNIRHDIAAIAERQTRTEIAIAALETRSCVTGANVLELQQLLPRQVPK